MKVLANFWKGLINTQNSDKSEGGGAENIPSEEIARLNEKINYSNSISLKLLSSINFKSSK